MKFTLAALVLATAASAASCASSPFAGMDRAELTSNIESAISIVCANPRSQDADIDLPSGRDGYSIHMPVGDFTVKVFAASSNGRFSSCTDMLNDIKTSCSTQNLKYGRSSNRAEYYAISVLPGNTNTVWV